MPSVKKPVSSDDLLAKALTPDVEAVVVEPEPLAVKRPDITPAQIIGLVPVVASLLKAFGVYDLSPEQQQALQDAVTAGLALIGADAVIRVGRSLSAR